MMRILAVFFIGFLTLPGSTYADRKTESDCAGLYTRIAKLVPRGDLDRLTETFDSYKLSKSDREEVVRLISNYKRDRTAPEKIAEIFGVKTLIHVTSPYALKLILKEEGLISGHAARKKYQKEIIVPYSSDWIGEYSTYDVFMAALGDTNGKKRSAPKRKAVLYFDLSLLNREDVSVSAAWNYGRTKIRFSEDPVGFVTSLVSGVRPEVIFDKKVPLDSLTQITVPKVPHKPPRGFDPNMWEVPYLSTMQAIEMFKPKPPPKKNWKSLIKETDFFLDSVH